MRSIEGVGHPSFCPRQGCNDETTGDIVHREPPRTSVTPASDQSRPIAFGLVQADEDDGRRQVEHEPEVAFHVGGEPVVLSLDEFATILRDGGDTLTRGLESAQAYRSSA